jgi:predicted ABC-type ATPase
MKYTIEADRWRGMLEMISDCVRRKESFAFETTLAARNYAHAIPIWHREGYWTRLHFLSLPSSDIAVARVAERIRQGGHSVQEEVIRRRFDAGLLNFEKVYKHIVSDWIFYDSAGDEPLIIDCGVNP